MLFQQQEIRDNRKEMQESNKQLSTQAKALKEQIYKIDRDFVHQNFFRILNQHFNTRGRIEFIYCPQHFPNHPGDHITSKKGKGEKAFKYYFEKLSLWVDDKKGWQAKMSKLKKDQFLKENGLSWCPKRPEIGKIGDPINLKFIQHPKQDNNLTKNEITFIFLAVIGESDLVTYLRSSYYLFTFMKEKDLVRYLETVEAGMGKFERVFLFYQLTTRFEFDGYRDLKDWLINNEFLAKIKPFHLLDPRHKSDLYTTKEDGPDYSIF